MSYNPYARYRYGGELYHGRKKISEGGARNGYSNTPGYTAKGRKAAGRIIGYQNGRPIYEYTDTGTGTPDPRSTAAKQKTLLGRVGLLAGRVGNTVSKAAGTVGRTVSGAANQAVKTVKKTARNAYNAVGNAWDGKAGYGSAKDDAKVWKKMLDEGTKTRTVIDGRTGKTIAKQNVQKEFNKHKSAYDRSIKGRLESAGRAISGAGRSAGNWLTGRANDVGKAARNVGRAIDKAWDGKAGKGSALDTARNFHNRGLNTRNSNQRNMAFDLSNQYRDQYNKSIKGRLESAGRAISGLPGSISKAARGAAGNAGNWLNERRRDLETAWDGKAGKGSAKDDAYEYFRQGEDGTDREGFREMDRYNRSIKGRLENAGKAVSKAARGASKFVSDRANDVGTAARGAAGKVRDTIGGAARDAGKFVSDRAGDVRRTANKARRAAEEAWDGKAGKGSAKDDAAKYRQRGLSGKDPNMKKIDFELGDKAAKKYSKSIKGQIENAPKNISKAVKGIGEKISGTASDASKKVSETASKAAKNLNTQVGKVTSEINRVKNSVSAGINYDKIQQDYQNMYVQYRQLQMRDSKAAKAMEPQMDAMRKAYLEMQRNYNSSSLGKISRDAADFVSSVTGSKRKKK